MHCAQFQTVALKAMSLGQFFSGIWMQQLALHVYAKGTLQQQLTVPKKIMVKL